MSSKKVVMSKKQVELLNNIFSIKVNDAYVFQNSKEKTALDQLIDKRTELNIEK